MGKRWLAPCFSSVSGGSPRSGGSDRLGSSFETLGASFSEFGQGERFLTLTPIVLLDYMSLTSILLSCSVETVVATLSFKEVVFRPFNWTLSPFSWSHAKSGKRT